MAKFRRSSKFGRKRPCLEWSGGGPVHPPTGRNYEAHQMMPWVSSRNPKTLHRSITLLSYWTVSNANVGKMVNWHEQVYSDAYSSMNRLSTKLSISFAITTWKKIRCEMPRIKKTIERDKADPHSSTFKVVMIMITMNINISYWKTACLFVG